MNISYYKKTEHPLSLRERAREREYKLGSDADFTPSPQPSPGGRGATEGGAEYIGLLPEGEGVTGAVVS